MLNKIYRSHLSHRYQAGWGGGGRGHCDNFLVLLPSSQIISNKTPESTLINYGQSSYQLSYPLTTNKHGSSSKTPS
jgi:hypothetical protein